MMLCARQNAPMIPRLVSGSSCLETVRRIFASTGWVVGQSEASVQSG